MTVENKGTYLVVRPDKDKYLTTYNENTPDERFSYFREMCVPLDYDLNLIKEIDEAEKETRSNVRIAKMRLNEQLRIK